MLPALWVIGSTVLVFGSLCGIAASAKRSWTDLLGAGVVIICLGLGLNWIYPNLGTALALVINGTVAAILVTVVVLSLIFKDKQRR